MNDLLLTEFDDEMKKTQTALERVPSGNNDFKPHPKSTPLGKLAPHIAQLAKAAGEQAAKVRDVLQNVSDQAWTEPWKLSFGGKPIFEGTRFLAYRDMFLNHIVHHRSQLGVYLRLTDVPVPATYGPSADDSLGLM